jgi:hypothetical protein
MAEVVAVAESAAQVLPEAARVPQAILMGPQPHLYLLEFLLLSLVTQAVLAAHKPEQQAITKTLFLESHPLPAAQEAQVLEQTTPTSLAAILTTTTLTLFQLFPAELLEQEQEILASSLLNLLQRLAVLVAAHLALLEQEELVVMETSAPVVAAAEVESQAAQVVVEATA